jgi:hypothetical protein
MIAGIPVYNIHTIGVSGNGRIYVTHDYDSCLLYSGHIPRVMPSIPQLAMDFSFPTARGCHLSFFFVIQFIYNRFIHSIF